MTRRRREIWIRMALGATSRGIVRRLVSDGLTQLLLGAGIGLVLSVAWSRAFCSLPYGVGAVDPAALLATLGALLIVGGAAVAIPAWRAAGVDPNRVLASE